MSHSTNAVPPACDAAELPSRLKTLAELLERFGVNERGRELIEQIRRSPPVRAVQGAGGNVTGCYPSRKMGFTVPYESRTGEFPFVIVCETDPRVYRFYPQPTELPIEYTVNGKKGPRRVVTTHIPDFFVEAKYGLGFTECKLRKELDRLVVEKPHRYVRDGNGFRSPPAEEAAAYYGLGHRIWTPCSVSQALTDNCRLLEAEWGRSNRAFSDDVLTRISECVRAKPAISLEELVHEVGDPDAVHWSIFHQHVYVDLADEYLAYADRVKVFIDQDAASIWHAAIESVPASPGPALSSTEVLARSRLAHCPPEAGMVALDRYHAIREAIEKDTPADKLNPRKHRRWLLAYRRAQRECGVGFVGLYPHTHCQGNHGCRLHSRTLDLMDEVAREEYETPRNVTGKAAYAVLVARCEEEGAPLVSYNRWMKHLRERDQQRATRRRKGRKQAAGDAPASGPTGPAVHGQGPLDIVHIDHTQLDVLVRYGTGDTYALARPWVSIALCAWSRCVVGYDVSFDSPATAGLFTTLRDLYVRHGRMPNAVVVDRGAEFGSIAFEELCAACSIQKIERPPGRPRFGSPIERFFHTLNTQFVHLLAGNTQLLKDPRQMSSEVDPARDAVWRLDELDQELSRFLFNLYPAQPHRGLNNMAPGERFEQGRELVGTGQALPPNSPEVHFLLWPPSKRGNAKVHFRTGIPVDNDRFWHPEMVDDGVRGTRVPVRVDPHDAGHVAACIKGRWVLCQSAEFAFVQGLSKRELRLASAAIRAARKARGDSSKAAIRVRELAQFVRDVRETEEGLREAIREEDRRRILERRGLRLVTDTNKTAVPPPETPWAAPDFDSVDPGTKL